MPCKDTRTSRYHDKAYKYLKFDFLPPFWAFDHTCIFLSSKMAPWCIYSCKRSFVDFVTLMLFRQFQHKYRQTCVCRHKCIMSPFWKYERYRYGRPLKMNIENQILSICMLYRDVLVSLRGMIYVCFVNTSYVNF